MKDTLFITGITLSTAGFINTIIYTSDNKGGILQICVNKFLVI